MFFFFIMFFVLFCVWSQTETGYTVFCQRAVTDNYGLHSFLGALSPYLLTRRWTQECAQSRGVWPGTLCRTPERDEAWQIFTCYSVCTVGAGQLSPAVMWWVFVVLMQNEWVFLLLLHHRSPFNRLWPNHGHPLLIICVQMLANKIQNTKKYKSYSIFSCQKKHAKFSLKLLCKKSSVEKS